MRLRTLWPGLVLLICVSALASAAVWSQAANVWSHPLGISMSVPDTLKATEDANGSISVQDAAGNLYVTFYPCRDADSAKVVSTALEAAVKKQFAGIALSAPRSGEVNGAKLELRDGPGKAEGADCGVTVGSFAKSGKQLVFFSVLAKANLATLEPQMSKLMNSVEFK